MIRRQALLGVVHRIAAALSCLALAGCASLATKAQGRGGDAVTEWTLIGDYYGNGSANWRTLAIMHLAMHDALNAARPVYGRWWPVAAGELEARGANPEVAMAAAAHEVLVLLHPARKAETDGALASVLRRYPDDATKEAGERLGRAIGRAAVERRAHDGFDQVHYFQGGVAPGVWRPTPSVFATSRTNDSRPFLFETVSEVPMVPPPVLGTPAYLEQLAQSRSLGALHSTARTPQQTTEAYFWAYQSAQRGFMHLAVQLLAAHRPSGGVHAEARLMAGLAAALADSAIVTWSEKAKYSSWRPITAIRTEGSDAAWEPLVETPPFPEYPSGHATDCYVGAGILEAAFPELAEPIVYLSSAHMEPLDGAVVPQQPASVGMGQHAQSAPADAPGGSDLRFPSLAAAAEDCSSSRIWAGAHFLAAEVESKRLADIIVRQALRAAPPVAGNAIAERAGEAHPCGTGGRRETSLYSIPRQ